MKLIMEDSSESVEWDMADELFSQMTSKYLLTFAPLVHLTPTKFPILNVLW